MENVAGIQLGRPSGGRLSIVATPIGNLGDLSPRARDCLAQADRVLVEDRRHAQKLFQSLGLQVRSEIFHEHNERARIPQVLNWLTAGEHVALISDAGMPLISDPGYPLVAAVRAAGLALTVLPGPNAALSALALSGLPSDRFVFEGFLPPKSAARRARLRALATESRTLLFYEAPHRILATLEDVAAELGSDRAAVLCRELSKIHEEVIGDDVAAISAHFSTHPDRLRGEMSLVLGGAVEMSPDAQLADRLLAPLLSELPLAQAVRLAEAQSTLPHRQLYQRALALTSGAESD